MDIDQTAATAVQETPIGEVMQQLGTTDQGLTPEAARQRLKRLGPNEINCGAAINNQKKER